MSCSRVSEWEESNMVWLFLALADSTNDSVIYQGGGHGTKEFEEKDNEFAFGHCEFESLPSWNFYS